jgi:16S rRNA processing protein RimM
MKARRRLSQVNDAAATDRNTEETGSPAQGEPVFLVVGRLRRPHGLHGELQMDVLTDFPERLVPGKQVYVGPDYSPYRIDQLRPHGKLLLVLFNECNDVDQAKTMTNTLVYVIAEELPDLPEGEYYHHELIGLSVMDMDSGEVLGQLEKILETGANDVYLVRLKNGDELLLPAIESVLAEVDLENREMRVHQQQWW